MFKQYFVDKFKKIADLRFADWRLRIYGFVVAEWAQKCADLRFAICLPSSGYFPYNG